MKTTHRLLLGTLATAAAVTATTAGAHADAAGPGQDDAESSPVNTVLCPVVTTGLLATALHGLNSQSVAMACGGVHSAG